MASLPTERIFCLYGDHPVAFTSATSSTSAFERTLPSFVMACKTENLFLPEEFREEEAGAPAAGAPAAAAAAGGATLSTMSPNEAMHTWIPRAR